VRRNVCGHTYRNSGGTVYKKIGISGRKNNGFFFRIIKVWNKINRIFVKIGKELHGNLGKSCFRITHGGGAVSVNGTEVSVSVDKRISHGPILSHVYQCSVDRAVAVGMVFTHRITDDTGALSVRLVGTVIQFNHGIKNTPLNRLKSVSYIGKRSGGNNAHRVIDVKSLHSFFQVYLVDFVHFRHIVKNTIIHYFQSFLPNFLISLIR